MKIILEALIIIGEITIAIVSFPYYLLVKGGTSEQNTSLKDKPADISTKKTKEKSDHTDTDLHPMLANSFAFFIVLFRSIKAFITKKTRKVVKEVRRRYTSFQKKHTYSSNKTVNAGITTYVLAKSSVLYSGKLIYLSFRTNFRYFYVGFFSCLLALFMFQSYQFVQQLPSPQNIGQTNFPLSSHIYDRNNILLYEIYSSQNRTPVELNNLPNYISQATIAIEDKDFFKHAGISPISGILRALKDTYKTQELQGGSTITQQLVKSALLTPERTIQRKFKEMILAIWAERIYTKEEILEMYLNQVPYGGSSYGVEEASKTFFGKSAKDISLEEAALLAGLPRAPSIYSPYINPELARQRRDQVLRNMYEQRFITKKDKDKAQSSPLHVIPPRTDIKAPHFVFYAKSELEKQFGIKQVEEGGLRIQTSLDLDIQQQAQQIVQEEVEKLQGMNISNAAVLVTNPSTGEILAMVGSTDYFKQPSGSFNVTTALRQPGSTIKPVMYSLALQNGGYTAATTINDKPVVYKIEGSEPYKPVNYDNKYRGPVTLRFALSNSLNIPAVKVLDSVGVQNFANHAQRMGIDTWTDPSRFGLSLTLGGVEVRMTDMAEAFGVFANMGSRKDLVYLRDIEDRNDTSIYTPDEAKTQVLNEGVAFIISDILSDNKTRETAFGPNSALVIPNRTVAVKTGTTNDVKDNWTIGFTQEFLVASWVGNNDNTPMNRNLVSGITGAAPIWNRVMTYLVENKSANPDQQFPVPANIVTRECMGRTEYFIAGTENTVPCRKAVIKKAQDVSE
jgi:1A family penicillin-binding protein